MRKHILLLGCLVASGCGGDLNPFKKKSDKKIIEVEDGTGCTIEKAEKETDDYAAIIDCNGTKEKLYNGTNGKDGADGKDGTVGPRGTPGSRGSTGPSGTPGTSGTNGTDGTHGRDGQDGEHGRDGNDGADGHDGQDGYDGWRPSGERSCSAQFWYRDYRYPLELNITTYSAGNVFYRLIERTIRRRDGVTTWVNRSSLLWTAPSETFVLNGTEFTAAPNTDLSQVLFTNLDNGDQEWGDCTSVDLK